MISLDEDEKAFVRNIIRVSNISSDVFFANVVNNYLQNIQVALNFESRQCFLKFNTSIYNGSYDFVDTVRDLSWKFMKFVRLLQYLEKHNYLYLYQETDINVLPVFGMMPPEATTISSEIKDADVVELLLKYTYKTIVVGQTLRDFVINDFKTRQELQHEDNMRLAAENLAIANDSLMEARRGITLSENSLEESREGLRLSTQALADSRTNIRIARKALYMALGLGVLGIIGSVGEVYYAKASYERNETQIDSIQFQLLDQKLQNIEEAENRLNALVGKINLKDTLITKIIPSQKEKSKIR